MRFAALALAVPIMTQAAEYSAGKTDVDGVAVVQLFDHVHRTRLSIAPSIGNMAYEMLVNGKNALWFPFQSPAALQEQPALMGIPFLAPWANRLEGDFFWANGKKYLLNSALGNLRRDAHDKPIHGLLNFSRAWVLMDSGANAHSAWATSRLEFWKYPDLMVQFPFAHVITMTYRLSRGELEVETAIENLSAAPMPVAVGFHPYLQVHDTPRNQWKLHIAARERVLLNDLLIPTGLRKPAGLPEQVPLDGKLFDDVFTDLVRDPEGRAHFQLEGSKETVTLTYGPKFTVAVVYAPARDFVCFEPMSAITDAFNLAHAGLYQELQSIPAGGTWKESFWLRTSGF